MDVTQKKKVSIITTLHERDDVRITLKQALVLSKEEQLDLNIVVSDGLGDEDRSSLRFYDVGFYKKTNYRIINILIGNFRVFKKVMKLQSTVVHFHDPELILVGFLFKIFRKKVIYDIHEDLSATVMHRDWIPDYLKYILHYFVIVIEYLAFLFFDNCIAATPAIASRFSKDCVVVQNFPFSEEFKVNRNMSNNLSAFIYSGGISELRGFHEMVSAMHLTKSEAKLKFAGEFYPEELETELAGIYSKGNITYKGNLSRQDLHEELSSSIAGLVLFHPVENHINSQPNKLFEYMSASLPVIASKFPLWEEIVGNNKCGILVDPLDSQEIASAIDYLMNNPQEAMEMGKRGRLAVESRYNWDQESKALIDLYKKQVID